MADEENILNWEKLLKEWIDEPEKKLAEKLAVPSEAPDEPIVAKATASTHKDKYFAQQHRHRTIIFYLIVFLAVLSFISFIGVIATQAYMRVIEGQPRFEILSDGQMQIFAVSVFVQIIGLIAVIAHSIWDNKNIDKM